MVQHELSGESGGLCCSSEMQETKHSGVQTEWFVVHDELLNRKDKLNPGKLEACVDLSIRATAKRRLTIT